MLNETRTRHTQTWQLGMYQNLLNPDPAEWVSASVPGAVHLDWGKAHDYPDYAYSDNYRQYVWMEDAHWVYRTKLAYPELLQDQRLFFVCGGVDYQFEVGVEEKTLVQQEGMFTPLELELTHLVKNGDLLWVHVFPIPKSFLPDPDLEDRARQRVQANHSCKPAVSYGWDFHPRLVPLGIWQDTFLEIRQDSFIENAELRYQLDNDCHHAAMSVNVAVNMTVNSCKKTRTLRWRLISLDGVVLCEEKRIQADESVLCAQKKIKADDSAPCEQKKTHSQDYVFISSLANPLLWWPHDQGMPNLYTSKVDLLDEDGITIDVKEQKIGFRHVRLVMNEDAWKEPAIFPKSRSAAPMTLQINGRRIFVKGSNWLSPQIFPGLLNRETYEIQLGMTKYANMNLLRCWGGAPVMKESFFDLCDELGIMVWQEFPMACNDYPDDAHYLGILEQESRSIVGQLRQHASVVLWCGGNELFNDWSGMDDQSLPLRLLNSVCYQMDPDTPFLMTSPLNGAAHGSYFMIDWSTGIEAWELFQKASNTAYCEFSTGAGLRSLDLLKKFIPEEALFPITEPFHDAWTAHKLPIHLSLGNLEHYFGPSNSIEELIERSQFLHGEGLKGVFEEVRRQKMHASMALSWCLNEPWPNAAGCGNLITWYNTAMPGLERVREACRPVLASARISKLKWHAGEVLAPELFVLSDAPGSVDSGTMTAWVRFGDEEIFLQKWEYAESLPNTNQKGPVLQFVIPDRDVTSFQFILKVEGAPELDSSYSLLLGKQ